VCNTVKKKRGSLKGGSSPHRTGGKKTTHRGVGLELVIKKKGNRKEDFTRPKVELRKVTASMSEKEKRTFKRWMNKSQKPQKKKPRQKGPPHEIPPESEKNAIRGALEKRRHPQSGRISWANLRTPVLLGKTSWSDSFLSKVCKGTKSSCLHMRESLLE